MSAHDVEQVLATYAPMQLHKSMFTLDRMWMLVRRLDNPQNNMKVVHVAGTSGKTSTAYFIRALLEASGVRTCLTVSPHIETIRERVQVGGTLLEEDVFVRYFNEFYERVQPLEPRPTFFELVTAFAYWVGVQENVDYFVAETGLGGRLDATNVVEREDKICVLTPIGFDHTDILGNTLAEIAAEKAGIIQARNDVFCAEQAPEVKMVFERIAEQKMARLTVVKTSEAGSTSTLPMYQQQNAILASRVFSFIQRRDGLKSITNIQKVITSVRVPGRWEMYSIEGKTVLLDGAHNPQKLEALLGALSQKRLQPAVVVAAFSEAPERKIEECAALVQSFANRTIFTEFQVERDVFRRSVALGVLQKMTQGTFLPSAEEAFEAAVAGNEPYVVVTGSLYLVASLRPYVQQRAASAQKPSLLH